MPKENIDYSNTIIYKIYCNDKNINDVYVGHTTNFTKRKHFHKSTCSNLNNKLKIYNIIRQYGGWDNWNMIEIAKYNCKDKTEARIKEQEHYDLLNSSLNSCPPYVDKNKYFCSKCTINCITKKVYETHINCSLHKKNLHEIKQKYCCEKCDYITNRKSNLENHFKSSKHIKTTNNNEIKKKISSTHTCAFCEKEYNDRAGLWRHKKKCLNKKEKIIEDVNLNDKELILTLIHENNELQKQILELIKNGTTNNSHNKTFNLEVF